MHWKVATEGTRYAMGTTGSLTLGTFLTSLDMAVGKRINKLLRKKGDPDSDGGLLDADLSAGVQVQVLHRGQTCPCITSSTSMHAECARDLIKQSMRPQLMTDQTLNYRFPWVKTTSGECDWQWSAKPISTCLTRCPASSRSSQARSPETGLMQSLLFCLHHLCRCKSTCQVDRFLFAEAVMIVRIGHGFHAQCIDSFYNNVSVPYIGLEWQHIDPHGNTNRSSCYQYTLATD